MRVALRGEPSAGEFAKKLLDIGDGLIPEENGEIKLNCGSHCASVEEIEENVFPDIANTYKETIAMLYE